MKKVGLTLIILAALAIAGVVLHDYLTTPKEEGVCKLRTVSSKPYLYEYDIVHFFWTTPQKPELLLDSPENITGQKLFFTIPFTHDNLNGCLFDHGQNHYTIYADLNGNNSLADEKPFMSRKKKYRSPDGGVIYLFGPVSFKTESITTAPFYLFLSNFTGGIHIAPTTIQKGKIKINNNIHNIMLADLDFDGEYKTSFSPEYLINGTLLNESICDRLLFGHEGDDSFVNRYFIRMDIMPLPKLLKLSNQYYSFRVDNASKEIITKPTQPEFGTLKLNTEKSSVELFSDTYSCFINDANLTTLPTGNYSVVCSQNNIKDLNGDIWTWRSARRSGPAADFEITANQQTTVSFPTSFSLKTIIEYKDKTCQISIKLFSELNKEYIPLFEKNDEAVRKPILTIYDEQNALMYTGTMEYG